MNHFKAILQSSGVISKLLVLVGLFLFFAFLSAVVMILLPGNGLQDDNCLKIMQLVQSICIFVVPPFILAYLSSKKPLEFLHLNKKVDCKRVSMVVVFLILIIPAINLLGSLNQQIVLPKALSAIEIWMKDSERLMAKLTEQLLSVHSLSELALNLVVIAVIPALGEELFFRGAIQSVLQQKMRLIITIWVTAILFSAIHMQFYGFFPRLLLGAFFGYLLLWSGSLLLPMVAHFTNNAVAVVFFYLKYNGYKVIDIDTIGTGSTLWVGVLSTLVVVFGFVFLKKQIKSHSC